MKHTIVPFVLIGMAIGCASSAPQEVAGSSASNALDAPSAVEPVSPAPSAIAPTAAELPRREAPEDVDRVACGFYWRRAVTEERKKGNDRTVVMSKAGDGASFKLGDVELRVAATQSSTGMYALEVKAESDTMLLSDRFELGARLAASHLPAAGHGFTGLRYVRPASKSDLQYFCFSIGPKDDPKLETLSQSRPGHTAGNDDFARCSVAVTDASGKTGSEQTIDIGKKRSEEQVSLALSPFVGSVQYAPGQEESGGLMLRIALPSGEGFSDMVQTSGIELPTNLFVSGGFTGVRSLTDKSTKQSVSYHCSAVKG
jgi:hypothetical protein